MKGEETTGETDGNENRCSGGSAASRRCQRLSLASPPPHTPPPPTLSTMSHYKPPRSLERWEQRSTEREVPECASAQRLRYVTQTFALTPAASSRPSRTPSVIARAHVSCRRPQGWRGEEVRERCDSSRRREEQSRRFLFRSLRSS